MTLSLQLAFLGYQAFIAAITAPDSGAPSCFTPMKFEELHSVVREAYLAAAEEAISVGGPDENTLTINTYNRYRTVTAKLPGPRHVWQELPPCLQKAWTVFTRTVISMQRN